MTDLHARARALGLDIDRFQAFALQEAGVSSTLTGDPIEGQGYALSADHLRSGRGITPAEYAALSAPASDPLDGMTVAELRAYAAAHDIDLDGASRKDDLLAAIRQGRG